MREILFKGKRLDNGEWVEGDLSRCVVVGETHICRIEDNLSTTTHRIYSETVCQCVGYAGAWEYDIFRCDDHLYLITYSETDLMWEAESLHSSESIQLGEFLEDEIEIVGNLLDNPELVEGTIYEKISKNGM